MRKCFIQQEDRDDNIDVWIVRLQFDIERIEREQTNMEHNMASTTHSNRSNLKAISISFFCCLMLCFSIGCTQWVLRLPWAWRTNYVYYIQHENSNMGVAYHETGMYDIVINKNGKIKSKGRVRDSIGLGVVSLKLIPMGNEYVWAVGEPYLDDILSKHYDDADRNKIVHIYDKNCKKIMTLPDNILSISGTSENLVIDYKYPEGFALTTLKRLIESNGKIDENVNKSIEVLHRDSPANLYFTKDLIFAYNYNEEIMSVYNRANGDLIKSINLERSVRGPKYFVEADKMLYWVGENGYGVSVINLETLEYRNIMNGDHESGIAVINNKIILMYKGRLIDSAKELMDKNYTILFRRKNHE